MKTILASASPRRKELIKNIFNSVIIKPADVDESLPTEIDPKEAPIFLAEKKALCLADENFDDLIIAADTIVLHDNKILGKPSDENDAKNMLLALSDSAHKVITGCALCYQGKLHSFSETSTVQFYPLSEEEIDAYIATGEPMDKAGAYGIQSKGGLFVKEIHGDYFNIVGLPIARLKREIASFLNNAK